MNSMRLNFAFITAWTEHIHANLFFFQPLTMLRPTSGYSAKALPLCLGYCYHGDPFQYAYNQPKPKRLK